MSEDNLRIVLAGLKLWNQGRFEEALELVHPDLEWRPGELFIDVDEVYRGHEGLMRFWEEFMLPFESITLQPARRAAGGDEVVIEAHFFARGRHGTDVDVHAYQRYTMRDGKLARFEAYPTWDEAMAAAGLA
ncbi:MAG TPA: nuclear transport factor 2 family protein [Thermoleophilaceae bacterium]|nr:nuclear transport factor 2 family protein [Thermoleophilaceae bacterium]